MIHDENHYGYEPSASDDASNPVKPTRGPSRPGRIASPAGVQGLPQKEGVMEGERHEIPPAKPSAAGHRGPNLGLLAIVFTVLFNAGPILWFIRVLRG
jgi:hypothetical protein